MILLGSVDTRGYLISYTGEILFSVYILYDKEIFPYNEELYLLLDGNIVLEWVKT